MSSSDVFDVTGVLDGVDWAPATVQAEVLQNVRTILSTRVGSVPLDREFGLDWQMIDTPTPIARARVQQEVYAKIRKYEPRAEVVSVTFSNISADAMEGRLVPTARIRINGDS